MFAIFAKSAKEPRSTPRFMSHETSPLSPPSSSRPRPETASVPRAARAWPSGLRGETPANPRSPRPTVGRPAWRRVCALLPFCLAGVVALTHCEPLEDTPPPATPATIPPGGGPTEVPPPGPPIPPSGAPAAGDNGKYASGEYAIGAETEGAGTDSYDDDDPAALTDFRKPLEPYGEWVDDPAYGTVWAPSPAAVGPDFQPYVTAGHWSYDDDYVWVSDYPWGWAPFHYGRWVFVDGRGWLWIPGREYRGAWVTWSVDDGYSYVGWAPIGPSFVWFGGAAVAWHGYWGPRWVYCPHGDVFAPRVGVRVIAGPAAVAVAPRMRPYAPGAVRVGGPPPARLGYAEAQVPRVSAAPSVARAQQFARPSTAQAAGAAAPTRFGAVPAARPANVQGAARAVDAPSNAARTPRASTPSFGPSVAPRPDVAPASRAPAMPTPGPAPAPARVMPGVAPATRVPAAPTPVTPAPARAPAVSPGPVRAPAPGSAPAVRGGGATHSGGHRR